MTLQRTFAEGDPAVTNAICVSFLENFLLVAETPEQLKLEAEQRADPGYHVLRATPTPCRPSRSAWKAGNAAILFCYMHDSGRTCALTRTAHKRCFACFPSGRLS